MPEVGGQRVGSVSGHPAEHRQSAHQRERSGHLQVVARERRHRPVAVDPPRGHLAGLGPVLVERERGSEVVEVVAVAAVVEVDDRHAAVVRHHVRRPEVGVDEAPVVFRAGNSGKRCAGGDLGALHHIPFLTCQRSVPPVAPAGRRPRHVVEPPREAAESGGAFPCPRVLVKLGRQASDLDEVVAEVRLILEHRAGHEVERDGGPRRSGVVGDQLHEVGVDPVPRGRRGHARLALKSFDPDELAPHVVDALGIPGSAEPHDERRLLGPRHQEGDVLGDRDEGHPGRLGRETPRAAHARVDPRGSGVAAADVVEGGERAGGGDGLIERHEARRYGRSRGSTPILHEPFTTETRHSRGAPDW